MKREKVTIVDYGIGNLLSVERALVYCGAECIITSNPETIIHSERVVLPGVGAFADGMEGLKIRGLIEPIYTFTRTGRPLLGICLGMQMLLDKSYEFGEFKGLGLISGEVLPIPRTTNHGKPHKIPHIGWNSLWPGPNDNTWDYTILSGIEAGEKVYFVHSFAAETDDLSVRLADTDYNGRRISAILKLNNIYGCQFHPEKSGRTGLHILDNFMRL